MNSDIVFINPPNVPFTSKGILIEPIDTLSLATTIKERGFSVSFLDMDVKRLLAKDLNQIFVNWPKILVIVFDYHIPLHDKGTNQEIQNICKIAKENACHVVLGGKAATFYPFSHIKELGADIFIKHDMEHPLINLLENFKATNFTIDLEQLKEVNNLRIIYKKTFLETRFVPQKPILNNLPIPDRSLVELNDYIDVRTILSSRGCNLQCTFCHVPNFWGVWQGKDVQQVVSEIEYLYQNYQVQKVLFLDDNAMAQPKRLGLIAQALKEKRVPVALGCLGTVQSYKKEYIKQMFDGGFRWIHYGAESGDYEQLQTMGKKITPDKIITAVQGTQEEGMRVRTSWILDMPELSVEGLQATENLILSHGANEIRLHFLTLRLGSFLQKKYNLETPQFIHNSNQNLNISGLDDYLIQESLIRIINGLTNQGYTLVKNPDDFIDIEQLASKNPELKIVSLCPLRYGLGWKY